LARSHFTLHSQAQELCLQDMTGIAAHFAGTPLPAGHRAAAQVPEVASLCGSCHGADGMGITPRYPTLAGQHADSFSKQEPSLRTLPRPDTRFSED
jgi:cytochrome c553